MRFFYNFKTRHPEKPYQIVLDYGLASIMMPTTLAGSQIGGFILDVSPTLVINVCLTLLLCVSAFSAFCTFRRIFTGSATGGTG